MVKLNLVLKKSIFIFSQTDVINNLKNLKIMLIKNYFKHLSFVYLFLLSTFILTCQENRQKKIEDQNIVSSKLLLQDIDTLESWIMKAHGDPFRFTTKEKFALRFEEAKQSLKNTNGMTGEMFTGIVTPIMAELRDGHSHVWQPNIDKLEGQVFLPFRIVFVANKPYIINNLGDENIPIGAEILEINGIKTNALFDKLSKLVIGDGNIKSSRYRKMESNFRLSKLLKLFGYSNDTYKIKFKPENGSINTYITKALTQKEYVLKDKAPVAKTSSKDIPNSVKKTIVSEALTFNTIDSLNNIGYLKIASFNPHYFQESYSVFEKEMNSIMKSIKNKKIKKLIIDVRNNSGGEDVYVLHLLRHLAKKKFSIFSRLTFKQNNYKFLPDGRHWDIPPGAFKLNDRGTYDATPVLAGDGPFPMGEFEPYENSFKGEIVVLINAYTFSAASDFSARLHYAKRAIFIGEETGGSYIGNVSGFSSGMDLPNSKVGVSIALVDIRQPFFDSNWTDRGVLPDIFIEPSVNDIIKGEDVVLKKALLTIRNYK